MTRLVLSAALLLGLSACTWDDRPDGASPHNANDPVYEPSEAYDQVDAIDLDDTDLVEPLDGQAVPPGPGATSATITEGTLPETGE